MSWKITIENDEKSATISGESNCDFGLLTFGDKLGGIVNFIAEEEFPNAVVILAAAIAYIAGEIEDGKEVVESPYTGTKAFRKAAADVRESFRAAMVLEMDDNA